MAKMSKTTKEIIQTVAFVLVVLALGFVYVYYPLTKSKVAMGRENLDDYNSDSLLTNDPAACIEAGLVCDTFRVEADGLTKLACLFIQAHVDSGVPIGGTVFLLHSDTTDRSAMLPWARQFADSGFNVVLYDQRASGYSTGEYHGEGRYEASDLEEVIAYLDIRDRINHPVVAIGRTVGADAAYLASLEEIRLDGIVAITPYLSTDRMLDIMIDRHGFFWFPLRKTMLWWWYNMRSSYAAPYREVSDIEAVSIPTLVYLPPDASDIEEMTTLKELSDDDLLEVRELPGEDTAMLNELFDFVGGLGPSPEADR